MKRNPPVGTIWRTLAGGLGHEPRISTHSKDYNHRENGATVISQRTTFDELVIKNGHAGESIHVEHMGGRVYFVGLGKEKRMVTLEKNGTISVGEVYE
jgi:hypothetical protein